MDIQALAQQVATFLVPFLPYLLKGGKLAGKKAAETVGEETIKALWAKLQPHEKVRKAAEAAANLRDNPAMQHALVHEIEGALRADPTLAAEIVALWQQVQGGDRLTAAGDRSVVIGGNASGSVIITGDQNTVQQGKYNLRIDRASGLAIGDNARVDSPEDEE